MSSEQNNNSSFKVTALESGIAYPDLESAPDEPLFVHMVGIQPDYLTALSKKFEVDLEDLQDLNDLDERPRLQIEDKFAMLVLRVPMDLEIKKRDYSTSPIGIFTNGRDIIVLQNDEIPLRKKRLHYELHRATSASEVIYNQWEIVIHSFESSLDIIELTIKRAEAAIQTEIYPTRLNEFFTLSSDAVYMEAALKANMRVLRQLKRVRAFGRMILDEDRLEELEVDLQQQMELSGIYMKLIDNAMNAYDTIVGHNMNTVMKVLTSVSLLVNVPTLVASIYGMNVGIPPEQYPGPFLVIMALTATLTIPVYLYLRLKDLV